MPCGHPAKTRPRRGAAVVLAAAALGALLAGCADDRPSVRGVPLVSGNTYDRHNALDVIYPDAERINVSYEFTLARRIARLGADGLFEGPAWLYADRQASAPERFVVLHLAKAAPDYEPPKGELVRLGQQRYYAFDHCVADWRDSAGPALAIYAEAVADSGFALSDDLYIRRYVSRESDSTGRRTDIVVVRDIVRAGYSCAAIGDFGSPESDQTKELIKGLRDDAGGSFEVIG